MLYISKGEYQIGKRKLKVLLLKILILLHDNLSNKAQTRFSITSLQTLVEDVCLHHTLIQGPGG